MTSVGWFFFRSYPRAFASYVIVTSTANAIRALGGTVFVSYIAMRLTDVLYASIAIGGNAPRRQVYFVNVVWNLFAGNDFRVHVRDRAWRYWVMTIGSD